MKNKICCKLALLNLIVLILISCERRPLTEGYNLKAQIPIHVDWSKSELTPQNVTLLVYSSATGDLVLEHRFEHNNNYVQSYIELPAGKYKVVTFNELRNEVDNVNIRGYDNLNTLEAYSIEDVNTRTRANSDFYTTQPGVFASNLISDFEVTSSMVVRSLTLQKDASFSLSTLPLVTDRLMNIIPLRNTCKVHLTLHVKGLNNARMPALVNLRNLATGYLINSSSNTTGLSTIQFTMNNRIYDSGSNTNGTISATITSFGVVGERMFTLDQPSDSPLLLNTLFMLVDKDKTVVSKEVDITKSVTFSVEENRTIHIYVNASILEPLPTVMPEGGDGEQGFTPGVTDWEGVDVPLVSN